MKKFLMAMLMGCLVIILGFPGTAFASAPLENVLYRLNANNQAISNLIPQVHRLEVPPASQMMPGEQACQHMGLTDRTIFSRNGTYGCVHVYDLFFEGDTGEVTKRLRLGLPNSENQVVNIPSMRQQGRYFTRQYPGFAIIGASGLPTPYHLGFWEVVGAAYDNLPMQAKLLQVDSNAVFWQTIPSNNPAVPSLHQLLIAENTYGSIGLAPPTRIASAGNPYFVFNVRDSRSPRSIAAAFSDFYFVLFGSYSNQIDPSVIQKLTRAIVSGTLPPPPNRPPVANSKFSLPPLTETQATNLPIDISNAFTDPDGDALTYAIALLDLPDGLIFDAATKQIIDDPTTPGNGPSPGTAAYSPWTITITAQDGHHPPVSAQFALTVQ